MSAEFDGWVVRDSRCSCCSGQGALVFVACVHCGHLSVICDEVGTLYLDPHDLESAVYGGISAGLNCPTCSREYRDFVPADDRQIKAAGFPDGWAVFQTGIPDPR